MSTRPKVFVVGFNRTGTSSLHELFRQSGLRSLHYRTKPANVVLPAVMCSNFSIGRPVLTGLDDFDAYMDMGMHTRRLVFEGVRLYRTLHEEYPDAYFILNTRPVEGWLTSRFAHGDGRFAEHCQSVYDCDADGLREIWRSQFEVHTREVRGYFVSNPRFLDFDITADDPSRIRDLLAPDYTIDPAHWGQRNSTAERLARLARSNAPENRLTKVKQRAAGLARQFVRRRDHG